MKSDHILFNNKPIYFNDSGNGNVIIFVHGFLESAEIWENFASTLGKTFRVITVDLPGHGKSAVFGEIHSMEFMAETVKLVLDHLGIEQCIMVGHSMGGYVTMSFAEQYPHLLRGIVLFNSHAAADSDVNKQNRTRTINLVKNDRHGFVTHFIPDLFAPKNVKKFSKEIERLKQIAEKVSNEAIIAALEGMKSRKDHQFVLENLNIPVMIIAGKDDLKIPLGVLSSQASLPHHCEFIMLSGVGHTGYIEAARTTQKLIKSFAERTMDLS